MHALNPAKQRKDDEFYTPRAIVRKVLSENIFQLYGRNVLCPCDSGKSEFVRELVENPLMYNYHSLEYSTEDIFSDGSIERIRRAGVVVTNPPFSILRKIVDLLRDNRCDFVLIAPLTYLSSKQALELVKHNEISISDSFAPKYIRPDGTTKSVTSVTITSDPKIYIHPTLNLTAEYDQSKYKTFEYNIKDRVEVL